MSMGKKIRLERIFNRENNRCIIVPMDHGVSIGPVEGIVNMKDAVQDMSIGGADAVLMHKGLVRCGHRTYGKDLGLIVHLSASTDLSPHPNSKTLVASVEEAIRLGADAVSIHVNIGDELERDMLSQIGKVSESAERWGMPLLAMVYARGPKVQNSFAPEVVAHCARVGVELGADVVKVPYTGDMDSFNHVVESCCVPVVIAGGAKMDNTKDFLQIVHDSVKAGGAGLSVGRNVFQHPNRRELVRVLRGIVHEDWTVEKALEVMGDK